MLSFDGAVSSYTERLTACLSKYLEEEAVAIIGL
jgi:hypothetical protein